ncbi:response regulator [Vibrio profundum]|uniref:response regulator n=1 Tax=Vibrio profundum TaxID=2910247 RepID=UPI003D0D6B97
MTRTLLLVEDDRSLREMLIDAFRQDSFSVEAFDNAEDALESAESNDFDLALLDVVLPGITGIEAITPLRRLQPSIGVVVYTAFATVDVAVDAMKKGADDFITKPIDPASLATTLKRIHATRSKNSSIDERSHDLIFSALANPIRRKTLQKIKQHRTIKFMDLCRIVGVSDHTKFNFHLKQLVSCTLVKKEAGRVYSLTEKGRQVYSSMLR